MTATSPTAAPTPIAQTIMVTGSRPFTLNGERKLHRYARAELVSTWRQLFAWQAKVTESVRPMIWCAVVVTPHLRKRVSQDLGGCFPTAKAAIDGLVDAGVLPSDGPDVVRTLTFRPPAFDGVDGLEVELIGEVA